MSDTEDDIPADDAAERAINEFLSAGVSGMKLSDELLQMSGADRSTPRQLGAFVMAIRTDCVVDAATFDDDTSNDAASASHAFDPVPPPPPAAAAPIVKPSQPRLAEHRGASGRTARRQSTRKRRLEAWR